MAYINGKEILFSSRIGNGKSGNGTLYITQNGVYDLSEYEKANVKVPVEVNIADFSGNATVEGETLVKENVANVETVIAMTEGASVANETLILGTN